MDRESFVGARDILLRAVKYAMLSQYTVKERIASGTFAKVLAFACEDEEAPVYALKVARKDKHYEKVLKKEFRILSLLGSQKGIVEMIGHTCCAENGFGIIMERYPMDLEGLYSDFCWEKTDLIDIASQFVDQIRPVIRYMHSKRIAHRDIKPNNILVSYVSSKQFRFCLADFGHAHWLSGNADTLSVTVPPLSYLAPEACVRAVLKRDRRRLEAMYSNDLVIRASDIWAAGVTALEVIYGDIVEPSPTLFDALVLKIKHCTSRDLLSARVCTKKGLARVVQSMIAREQSMCLQTALGDSLYQLLSPEFEDELRQMLQYCPFRRMTSIPKFRRASFFSPSQLPILDTHQLAMFRLLFDLFSWKVVVATAVMASDWIWTGAQLLAMVEASCEFIYAVDGYEYFQNKYAALQFPYTLEDVEKTTIPKIEDHHCRIHAFIKHCQNSESPFDSARTLICGHISSYSPE